jgi:hypothetical protein
MASRRQVAAAAVEPTLTEEVEPHEAAAATERADSLCNEIIRISTWSACLPVCFLSFLLAVLHVSLLTRKPSRRSAFFPL